MDTNEAKGSALIVVGFILFAVAIAPGVLLICGWLFGTKSSTEHAKDFASAIAPILTVCSFLIATYVAYESWLSPFKPAIEARPYVWRAGPGVPAHFAVTIYMTATNQGALPGTISDFLVEIRFPKKKWVMEPRFFEDAERFTHLSLRPEVQTTPPFDSASVGSYFAPISLAGRSQVTKVITFTRGNGVGDADAVIEPGMHMVRLYARRGQ